MVFLSCTLAFKHLGSRLLLVSQKQGMFPSPLLSGRVRLEWALSFQAEAQCVHCYSRDTGLR